jgi:hypothetical protein
MHTKTKSLSHAWMLRRLVLCVVSFLAWF